MESAEIYYISPELLTISISCFISNILKFNCEILLNFLFFFFWLGGSINDDGSVFGNEALKKRSEDFPLKYGWSCSKLNSFIMGEP